MVFVEFQLEVGKQQYQKGKAEKDRTRTIDCIGNDEIKKSQAKASLKYSYLKQTLRIACIAQDNR